MRAQQFSGELERYSRPRGRFIEEQSDALAAEQGLHSSGVHPARQLEKGGDFVSGEMFQAEQRTSSG